MKDLKFNIYGFTAPQTRAEYLALLDEALSLADELNAQLDANLALLEQCADA